MCVDVDVQAARPVEALVAVRTAMPLLVRALARRRVRLRRSLHTLRVFRRRGSRQIGVRGEGWRERLQPLLLVGPHAAERR